MLDGRLGEDGMKKGQGEKKQQKRHLKREVGEKLLKMK